MSDSQAIAKFGEGKVDKSKTDLMPIARRKGGGVQMAPANTGQAMEIAKMMAISDVGVRKHLRRNPGACLSVCLQAMEWGMNPFSVANKSYAVNDQIAYESQLVAAVLNTRAPIKGRLKYEYAGEGQNRKCTCTATLKGEDEGETVSVTSPPIGQITPKNSPLWKNDPDQQLAYYTARALARRHFPEVLLGVYAEDELEPVAGGRLEGGRVVAAEPAPRPKRSDYREGAIDAEPEPAPVDEHPLYDVNGDRAGVYPLLEAGQHLVQAMEGTVDERPHDCIGVFQMNGELVDQLPDAALSEMNALFARASANIEAANKRAEGGDPPANDEPPAHFDEEAPPAEEAAQEAESEPKAAPAKQATPPEPKAKKEPKPGEAGFNVDRWVRARLRELERIRTEGDAGALSAYWQDVTAEVEAVEAEHPGDAKEVRDRRALVAAALDSDQAQMRV